MTEVIKSAVAYFQSRGWTLAQACGIVANLQAESGLRPDAVGDGGQAYGVAQWHPDRQAAYERAFGASIKGSSVADQLAFVVWELHNTESAAGIQLATCTTPQQAAETICRHYERPADQDGESAKRAAIAQQFFDEVNVDNTEQGSSASTLGQTIASAAPIVAAFNPIAGLITGLAGTLIQAFQPLAQEKLTKELARHTDNPQVAQQTAQNIVDAAVSLTHKADPVEATVAARQDPVIIQQIQQIALDKLDELAPIYDRLAQYAKQERDDDVAGKDAASIRASHDKWDMTKALVFSSEGLAWLIIGSGIGIVGYLLYLAKIEVALALLSAVGSWVALILKNRSQAYDYRFDGSPTSNAASQAVQQQLNFRLTKQGG